MGLKDLVANAVKGAIAATDDLADTVTFIKHGGNTYDPETGTNVEGTTSYPGIKAVMPRFSADEKDDQVIMLTDSKCLIAALDLPVVPDTNDELISPKGKWDVIRLMGVPGDSLYILHVRKVR